MAEEVAKEETELKKEKKKLIEVQGCGDDGYYQNASTSVFFALMSKPEGNVRKQSTKFMTCRDYINDSVRAHVHEGKVGGCSMYSYGRSAPIDMDKLRLLVYRPAGNKKKLNESNRERIFSGKAAVNLYEDFAGWEKTKITTVNHSNHGKQVWLMTGSGNWMKASNMISMITLIMRIASNHGPLKTDSLEELNNSWKAICKKNAGYDVSYLKDCWEKFPLIVKHWKEIFSDPIDKTYPGSDYNYSFHGCGGVVALCRFGTNIEKVDQRFKEVCRKNLKEIL